MIHIKHITMKNFLSVGAVTQSVTLAPSGLTLILGENLDQGGADAKNGVGKCLRGSTQIHVNFSNPDTERKFKEFMSKRMK